MRLTQNTAMIWVPIFLGSGLLALAMSLAHAKSHAKEHSDSPAVSRCNKMMEKHGLTGMTPDDMVKDVVGYVTIVRSQPNPSIAHSPDEWKVLRRVIRAPRYLKKDANNFHAYAMHHAALGDGVLSGGASDSPKNIMPSLDYSTSSVDTSLTGADEASWMEITTSSSDSTVLSGGSSHSAPSTGPNAVMDALLDVSDDGSTLIV